jgi:hypothetical protein
MLRISKLFYSRHCIAANRYSISKKHNNEEDNLEIRPSGLSQVFAFVCYGYLVDLLICIQ